VPGADELADAKTQELLAAVREIQQRVRARHPAGKTPALKVPLADLMPLVHARDAAEAKVASIGTVNPRPPGLLNDAIQAAKRLVARLLDWHVREQVEFNRGVIECVNRSLEALNELNRALAALDGSMASLTEEARELRDIRHHWHEWRQGWEQKLAASEIHYLRGLADLQAAFEQRVGSLEASLRYRVNQLEESEQRRLDEAERRFRELAERQHADFSAALARTGQEWSALAARTASEIERRFAGELERFRLESERLIHNELRVVRQRLALSAGGPPPAAPAPPPAPQLDWLRFAGRFRGSEEYVKQSQRWYIERFRGCRNVLDLGCGRGEFLELAAEAGIPARGVDISDELVALARAKGLAVERADLLDFLGELADHTLDGLFCAHVIEHLPAERLPRLVELAAKKLCRGGVLAIETPNPECLASLARHFFIDPTHTRPVPASLLVFYLEEAGFGQIEVRPLAPAVDSFPALAELPEAFRSAFFGGLDYAVLARRL
jgi:SAM-dependent methyltransferase